MGKAMGIGGIFLRSADPATLAAWYRDRLGIDADVAGGDRLWMTEAGRTVFAAFPAASDYWPANRPWMINFRVTDLAGLIESLRAADVEVRTDPGWDDPTFGRFARIHDPEGNPIELWEPPAG